MPKEIGPKEKAQRAAREQAYAERHRKGQVEPEKSVQPPVRKKKKSE